MRWLSIFCLIFLFACSNESGEESSATSEKEEKTSKAAPAVKWHPWSQETFDLALAENKLIHIDAGVEGCTACRWMSERTYTNKEVIEVLNEHFICIQVDAETNPELGSRFAKWAWPALVFLSPEGQQVAAIRGNRPPKRFLPALYDLIEAHNTGTLDSESTQANVDAASTEETELSHIRALTRKRLAKFAGDDGYFGRRGGKYYGRYKAVFIRHFWEGGQERFLKAALDGMTQQIDPVWGGAFVVSIDDWSNIIPEKRSGWMAGRMYALAEGYHLYRDKKYLDAALMVHKYYMDWMRSPEGTFFTSQEDDAPDLPKEMHAKDYYALASDQERRQYGIPPIDHAVYTDINGQVISAYAKLYEATGDPALLDVAEKAAKALLKARLAPSGGIYQARYSSSMDKDNRMRTYEQEGSLYLKTQGLFGEALLDLYRVTADSFYLESAKGIYSNLGVLKAPLAGYYLSDDPGIAGMDRLIPLEENALICRFMYKLGIYTANDEIRDRAVETFTTVFSEEKFNKQGSTIYELAWTAELMNNGFVEVVVTGQENSLFEDLISLYAPEKLLHYDRKDKYNHGDDQVALVCTENTCSAPLNNCEEVGAKIGQLTNQELVAISCGNFD